ncbi:MAG: hypothetical protein AABX79_03080 [Nanoarchaeota archaeon]
MINEIRQIIIGRRQKRKVRELEEILGNVNNKFWKSDPTDEQVDDYHRKINQIDKNSLSLLDQRLNEFKQNPARETALAFERAYDQELLYKVEPLEEVSGSFDRVSNYVAKGLIGLMEIAETLKEKDNKVARKLAKRAYNWGLHHFHPNLSVEGTLKYWYCGKDGFGIALPHMNNSSYPIELLYSIVSSAKLLNKSEELKSALLRVPEIKEFLETREGLKLRKQLFSEIRE